MPALIGAAVDALRATGQRGVIGAAPHDLVGIELPPSVLPVQEVPHAWLFPRMRLILHHGGAGTTGAALRSGMPSAVVPFWADHFLWARRTFELGVGPRPVPSAHLTAQRLGAMIESGKSEAAFRTRASELGQRLRSEDGVARAVEFLSRLVV